MMRLPAPVHSFEQTIDACAEGITGNEALRLALIDGKGELVAREPIYRQAASRGRLFSFAPIPDGDDAPIIGDLRKTDLIKLYEQYLVPRGKPGRRVYSDLLNAALEQCPFCGGIGVPRTLDHFLAKAKHPVFSVLPFNLVPSCRDCNMGEKGQAEVGVAEELLLHPYIDKDMFFDEQWIFSSYNTDDPDSPGYFSYFVNAPAAWDPADVARAENHFRVFKLGHAYGLKAAQSLATVMGQADALLGRGLSRRDVREIILEPGIARAPFPNHWQRGMFQSLCGYFS